MKFLKIAFLLVTANISLAYSIDFLPVPATNVIRHTYYTLSFNESYEQANWVYYTLTDSMVLNSGEERSNSFKADKLVASSSAKSSDYSNSGYDRGHLCPAADMGFNHKAMQESFLMSNVSPQEPDFNRGIWKVLEMQVREWATKEHKLYIVTGPIFKDNKGTIGIDKVLVPGYFFKVIYDPTDQPKLIAFLFPNKESNLPLTDFAVTADSVEKMSGFDLFSQLPDDQENWLESKVQLAGWFEGYVAEKSPEFTTQQPSSKTPDATIAKDSTQKNNTVFFIILVVIILIVILYFSLNGKKKR